MQPRIALIVAWFGKFPDYFDLFVHSVAVNPLISYHIWTNQDIHPDAPNIYCHKIEFDQYCQMVSDKLNIRFTPRKAYKMCDLKPFLPLIHTEDIKDYEFVGFADIDLIYGDMSDYLKNILDKTDFFSAHADRVAGHFFFMRNTPQNRELALRIPNWQHYLTSETNFGIDEGAFCDVICWPLGVARRIWHRSCPRMSFGNKWFYLRFLTFMAKPFVSSKTRFKELHSTHCALPPTTLNYRWSDTSWIFDGKTIRGVHNGKKYPYLHFLFLKTEKEIPCAPVWDDNYYQVKDLNLPVIIDRKGIRNFE